MGDKITKVMPPPVMGKDMPLAGIFDTAHERYGEAGEFRALYEADPEVKKVVDTARGLEGLKRQWGVHAAGVILSREPLLDVIPIIKREQDGAIITQFDMGACESLGLLKMDFLGLRNLTVLDDALRHIKDNRGEELVLETMPLDAPEAYELLCQRRHHRRVPARGRADALADPLDAALDVRGHRGAHRAVPARPDGHGQPHRLRRAQARPRSRWTRSTRSSPRRSREILAETYGVIVYQEQVMAIAQKVAGYTLGQADLLRRAMGKKKKSILDKEYVPFSDGMKANGYSAAGDRRSCGRR